MTKIPKKLKFTCPLCGCKEFIYTKKYFYECNDCSLIFGHPEKISRIDIKRRIKEIEHLEKTLDNLTLEEIKGTIRKDIINKIIEAKKKN